MSVFDFVRTIPERGLSGFLGDVRVGLRRRSNWLEKRARNVYSREWDVLVILDGCRVDLMESVVEDYDFITSVSSLYSVGSTSDEWMQRTFGEVDSATLESTAYVTANAHLQHTDVNSAQFGVLDDAWRYRDVASRKRSAHSDISKNVDGLERPSERSQRTWFPRT